MADETQPKRARFVRDRHKITEFKEDGTKAVTKFSSRSLAKQESRRLQALHGPGSVRVRKRRRGKKRDAVTAELRELLQSKVGASSQDPLYQTGLIVPISEAT